MKTEFSRQIFEKYTNIRFHEDLFSGNTVALFVRTDWRTDRQTDRQTDRHAEAICSCSKSFDRA